jgi:hypothetical protein
VRQTIYTITARSELIFSKIAGVSHKMPVYVIRYNVLNAEGMRVEPHLTVVNQETLRPPEQDREMVQA